MKVYYEQTTNSVILENQDRLFPNTLIAEIVDGQIAIKDKDVNVIEVIREFDFFQREDGSQAGTDINEALAYLNGQFQLYTDNAGVSQADVDNSISESIVSLIGNAPSSLDTLNELADALGDDPNFAATVTSQLSQKANSSDLATVATSNDYNDLDNKPANISIPVNISAFINDSGYITGDDVNTSSSTSLIATSGRFYLYTDLRWVTDSDDNYGAAYYQFNESGGTGLDPITEWEHMGFFIPKGKTVKKLHFTCRANNTEVTDFEIHAVLRRPDPITRWETGMDNDAEDVDTLLLRDLFVAGSPITLGGNMGDRRRRTFDINTEATEDSYLSIYIKPIGVLSATRYLMTSYTWEIE